MNLASEVPDFPKELAHDWFGLATWAIIAIALVIAIRTIFQVKHQVKNSHEENLRDDLDNKFASLEAKMGLALDQLGDHGDRLNSIEEHLRDR